MATAQLDYYNVEGRGILEIITMLRDEDYRINITGTQPPPPTDADNDDQSLRYYIIIIIIIINIITIIIIIIIIVLSQAAP